MAPRMNLVAFERFNGRFLVNATAPSSMAESNGGIFPGRDLGKAQRHTTVIVSLRLPGALQGV